MVKNHTITRKLRVTSGPFGTDGSGNYAAYLSAHPKDSDDWTSFKELFTSYRVLEAKVEIYNLALTKGILAIQAKFVDEATVSGTPTLGTMVEESDEEWTNIYSLAGSGVKNKYTKVIKNPDGQDWHDLDSDLLDEVFQGVLQQGVLVNYSDLSASQSMYLTSVFTVQFKV